MNLNVNCQIVKQENFTASKGTDKCIYNAIEVENRDTFQNSPIHLFFMKSISNQTYQKMTRKQLWKKNFWKCPCLVIVNSRTSKSPHLIVGHIGWSYNWFHMIILLDLFLTDNMNNFCMS